MKDKKKADKIYNKIKMLQIGIKFAVLIRNKKLKEEVNKMNKVEKASSFIIIAVFLAVLWGSQANAFEIQRCEIPAGCDGLGGAIVPLDTLTNGWDGLGLGSWTLDYYVGNHTMPNGGLPTGFTLAQVEPVIQAAMATWSSVVQVSWNKIGDYTDGGAMRFEPNSVDIYWHDGAGGAPDGNPFDGAWNPSTGAGNIFAHGWAPEDIEDDILAGNIHFDVAESWVTSGAVIGVNSATIDLQSIMLHELGHVLGLDHENDLGQGLQAPVMQSFYWGEQRTLRADDIAGVQSLYCPTGQICARVPEPGTLLLLGSGLTGLFFWRRKKT